MTFKADTRRLEEHGEILRQEQSAVRRLLEHLRAAKKYAPEEDVWRYNQLLAQVETLERYFRAMADQVDHASVELAHLSLEVKQLLQDAARK